jgi:Tetracyclin repressor-like, C-terminal domain
MQAELSPLGIKVTIIEPGSFRTSFLDGGSLHTTANKWPDYAATAGRVRQDSRPSASRSGRTPSRWWRISSPAFARNSMRGVVSAFYASPVGSVFAPLLANAMQDPVAAEWLRTRFLDSRQRGTQELWDRAVSRGEVRKDLDPDLAMDLLSGPIMWRLVSGRRPLSEDAADAFVNSVLNGLRAG